MDKYSPGAVFGIGYAAGKQPLASGLSRHGDPLLLFHQGRAASLERPAQLVIAKRLHQIIRGVHLIAVYGKICCGCGKDQTTGTIQLPDLPGSLHARHAIHVNVQKDNIIKPL